MSASGVSSEPALIVRDTFLSFCARCSVFISRNRGIGITVRCISHKPRNGALTRRQSAALSPHYLDNLLRSIPRQLCLFEIICLRRV